MNVKNKLYKQISWEIKQDNQDKEMPEDGHQQLEINLVKAGAITPVVLQNQILLQNHQGLRSHQKNNLCKRCKVIDISEYI